MDYDKCLLQWIRANFERVLKMKGWVASKVRVALEFVPENDEIYDMSWRYVKFVDQNRFEFKGTWILQHATGCNTFKKS